MKRIAPDGSEKDHERKKPGALERQDDWKRGCWMQREGGGRNVSAIVGGRRSAGKRKERGEVEVRFQADLTSTRGLEMTPTHPPDSSW